MQMYFERDPLIDVLAVEELMEIVAAVTDVFDGVARKINR